MSASADCRTMRLLVQADHDGELDAAQAATVAAHLEGCAACARLRAELAALSHEIRGAGLRHAAPGELAARLGLQARPPARPGARPSVRPSARPSWRSRGTPALAGLALAASLALLLWPGGAPDPVAAAAVGAHIRALQPGHLLDVPSSDHHTVRPWFAGRLDFAPPVPDFAAQGFPLVGGRLDYLAGRPVAALVYRHGQHLIDVFVWPGAPAIAAEPVGRESDSGYEVRAWSGGGMAYRAVSDLAPAELDGFAALWRDVLAKP